MKHVCIPEQHDCLLGYKIISDFLSGFFTNEFINKVRLAALKDHFTQTHQSLKPSNPALMS